MILILRCSTCTCQVVLCLRYSVLTMVKTAESRPHELRIIAGQWRGRRWRFPCGPDIRPTPNRIRETLFNWLAPSIRGAHVLDLFAGSGALGLESLSRGAIGAVFIDTDQRSLSAIRKNCTQWGAVGSQVLRSDALTYLAQTRPSIQAAFDIIFIDPPFDAGLWQPVCARLEAGRWLAPEAFVYIEAPAGQVPERLSSELQPWRTSTAGAVGYHLLRRECTRSD